MTPTVKKHCKPKPPKSTRGPHRDSGAQPQHSSWKQHQSRFLLSLLLQWQGAALSWRKSFISHSSSIHFCSFLVQVFCWTWDWGSFGFYFPRCVKQLWVLGIGSLKILFPWQESNHSSQGFYIFRPCLCNFDCQKLFMASWLPCSQGCVQQCLVSICSTISFHCCILIADAKATLANKKAVFLPPKLRN